MTRRYHLAATRRKCVIWLDTERPLKPGQTIALTDAPDVPWTVAISESAASEPLPGQLKELA